MDALSTERRSENMRRIRSRDTSPEMVVRKLAHGLGFRYRLHVAALPGRPDLVFPRLLKIIEVRGCFWHQHRGCVDSHIPKSRTDYWEPKLAGNKQRDEKNRRSLMRLGWRVMVVWECETRDEDRVARKLSEFLKRV